MALLSLLSAIEGLVALVRLIALTESVATLQLISGLLLIAIRPPAGILLPVLSGPALPPRPRRRQIWAGPGAAAGLVTGPISFGATTVGFDVMERFGQGCPPRTIRSPRLAGRLRHPQRAGRAGGASA